MFACEIVCFFISFFVVVALFCFVGFYCCKSKSVLGHSVSISFVSPQGMFFIFILVISYMVPFVCPHTGDGLHLHSGHFLHGALCLFTGDVLHLHSGHFLHGILCLQGMFFIFILVISYMVSFVCLQVMFSILGLVISCNYGVCCLSTGDVLHLHSGHFLLGVLCCLPCF